MDKQRTFELKKNPRTSGFIHIGEIIPGVLKDVEKRVKDKRNPVTLGIPKVLLKNK